jgi:hypothetical protein
MARHPGATLDGPRTVAGEPFAVNQVATGHTLHPLDRPISSTSGQNARTKAVSHRLSKSVDLAKVGEIGASAPDYSKSDWIFALTSAKGR